MVKVKFEFADFDAKTFRHRINPRNTVKRRLYKLILSLKVLKRPLFKLFRKNPLQISYHFRFSVDSQRSFLGLIASERNYSFSQTSFLKWRPFSKDIKQESKKNKC